jgi:hypothetical protein
VLSTGCSEGSGDAEVHDTGMPCRQQDVLRLDIPVGDIHAVRVSEGVGDFPRDADRVLQRKLSLPKQPLPERLPMHSRHHIVERTVGVSGVEQRDDVGMIEASGQGDLSQETL